MVLAYRNLPSGDNAIEYGVLGSVQGLPEIEVSLPETNDSPRMAGELPVLRM
jgi:hypothetical protein